MGNSIELRTTVKIFRTVLLEKGAYVHCADIFMQTTLCVAASTGNIKAIKLVEYGAKVDNMNPRDEDEYTSVTSYRRRACRSS